MEKIEVKDIESFKVAAMRVQSSRSKEEDYFRKLLKWLKQRDVKPRKKLTILYDELHEFSSSDVVTYEVCFEIKEPVERDERVQIRELPEQRMATITHRGPCEGISSTYKALLEWIEKRGFAIKGPPREIYIVHPSLTDKVGSKDSVTEILLPIGGRKLSHRLFAFMKSWMFPHLFAVFQWVLLLAGVMSLSNFPIIISGSRTNGEFKVVMTTHLWVLLFSIMLGFLFYKHRHRGVTDKWIFGISMLTALFSVVNFVLHFLNGFLLLMWVTEIIAWVFYLVVLTTSLYKISATLIESISRIVLKT